ncbi:uridine diphosphate glucose pyrophosphatase NUDT22 [Toxotes jaculatrix]|uniref:uridine diphosphate glucose pyrophosphatase NUDT22 n=1 Tax=Toxotes jaculatrix TaxID=941984 RepID=UPI001B3AC6C0|nr:uridine diphosphate glucose pyrophosphatase NUDT22 [Toxotes jaculatrix]XP_040904605.1 uridine diphosphate glucose pyrophosphatase NUDT22 [Toxotes jaculatrix]
MMDPEVSVLLHCSDWRGLLQSQVQVELSERFNRQTDLALERHIEEVWTERVSKEPWLFNGAKFRLHSFCLASTERPSSSCASPRYQSCAHSSLDCVEDQEGKLPNRERQEDLCDTDPLHSAAQNGLDQRNRCRNQTENVDGVIQQTASAPEQVSSACRAAELSSISDKDTDDQHTGPLLTLRLGLTCYKDYLGTNWSCQVVEIRQRGEVEFGDPLALLAQPLGVGAVLCTDDGQVVLIRRSQRVAEAGGLLDIPGGHPEPKAVCEEVSMAMMQQRPEAVISELFSSVCAEIRDEVNVPLSCLGEPVLMGVALNHTSAGRPSAEFYVSCSLTRDEVRKMYWKGGAEAHESTDIVFLSRTEVLQLDRSSPLWSELCPSAKGAVLLYQTVKPDGD